MFSSNFRLGPGLAGLSKELFNMEKSWRHGDAWRALRI
jgi:hypothetical protein